LKRLLFTRRGGPRGQSNLASYKDKRKGCSEPEGGAADRVSATSLCKGKTRATLKPSLAYHGTDRIKKEGGGGGGYRKNGKEYGGRHFLKGKTGGRKADFPASFWLCPQMNPRGKGRGGLSQAKVVKSPCKTKRNWLISWRW